MTSVRPAAVAGYFYPAEPAQLRKIVNRFLDTALPADIPHPPKAIIAPHAGYIYSGPIAGSAFKPWQGQLDKVTRFVIIGPAHTLAIQGLATVTSEAFASPLGAVPVDKAAIEQIRPFPQVYINDPAHTQEHGLEVMLPFLQTLSHNFKIVPLVVGETTGEAVAEVLASLWGGPETCIIISSDLSHYHDYETAQRLDKATAAAIEARRPAQLSPESACGRLAIEGLLATPQAQPLTVKTVDLRNSGDTAGSKDRVVGYGAFLFL